MMAQEQLEKVAPPTPDEVMDRIRPVEDPELRMSIVELGLIYEINVNDEGVVEVIYTLTTPACPIGPLIAAQIQDAVMSLAGVTDVETTTTFTPLWDPRTMASDEVRMQLGMW